MEEINLNEGINPQIQYNSLSPQVNPSGNADRQSNAPLIPADINTQIEKWNENPKVKEAGVRAEKISVLNFWKYMGILGIVCFFIIALSIGYSVYTSGSLVPSFNLNMTCSTIPPCPACSTTCGSFSCNMTCPKPSDISINIKCNATG